MSLSVCNVKASIRFKTKQKTYSMQKPHLKQKKFVTCMFLITNEIYFIHATVEAANPEQYQVIYSGNLELTAKGFLNSIASYRQYSFLSTTNETHIKSGNIFSQLPYFFSRHTIGLQVFRHKNCILKLFEDTLKHRLEHKPREEWHYNSTEEPKIIFLNGHKKNWAIFMCNTKINILCIWVRNNNTDHIFVL